ncbi:MAG: MBOAT family O-acyltransferase [Imperialibacter sp.]|uniref:MBOAT family O-acyltransferase n=1 Tax=Imperialibacter sp. TaxID=2038411 RepID=UPI0032EEAAF8
MLFNSIEFLLFLPVVFALYWFVFGKSLRLQNMLLLLASYVFYGWWDWRFLSLIFLSTVVDFITGLRIDAAQQQQTKKNWLTVSLVFNLGLLGFFKYYNFFVSSWIEMFSQMGIYMDPWTMNIVLPVGISFYTFQTMSYSLDIYYGRLQPTKNFVNFAAFVSFFPQLVAGPIERASSLLPQIANPRKWDYRTGVEGLRQILFGLFKKVVIADSLSGPVNEIFSNYPGFAGGTLVLGALFFALQIYCDFSGYSDIAIGVAKLFGIKLMVNFNFPYFSSSIAEFWRKWHISLSTWFRDYVYYPLGGSRVATKTAVRNIFVVFLVSGLWHGANWTFVVWGALHALYFIPSFYLKQKKVEVIRSKSSFFLVAIKTAWTFLIVCFAWIFFRSESLASAFDYIRHLSPHFTADYFSSFKYVAFFLMIELLVFFFKRIDYDMAGYRALRYFSYAVLAFSIISHSTRSGSDFIYFQF